MSVRSDLSTTGGTCPGPDLLLLWTHDLLEEEDDAPRLAAHVAGCDACRARQGELEAALEAPAVPPPPPEVFAALCERIAAEEVRDAARTSLPAGSVRLTCTYCRDQLPAAQATYCAGCLAPHHEECFLDHGRCAVAGCEGQGVVRRADAPASPTRRRRSRTGRGFLIVLAAAGGMGAAAAYQSWSDPIDPTSRSSDGELSAAQVEESILADLREERARRDAAARALAVPTPTPTPAPTPAPSPPALHMVAERYDVSNLVGATTGEADGAQRALQRLTERKATLNFPDTPLSEVLLFLRDITDLNFVTADGIDPDALRVNFRVQDARLDSALRGILEQVGARAIVNGHVIRIAPATSPRASVLVLEPDAPAAAPRRAPGSLDERGLRELIRQRVAPGTWIGTTRLEVVRGQLFVNHVPDVHIEILGLIQELTDRDDSERRDLQPTGPWFHPAVLPPVEPFEGRRYELLHARRLDLNLDETPLLEALQTLSLLTGLELHLSPAAEALLSRERPTVSLRLRGIQVGDALRLVLAAQEGLEFSLARDGLHVRTSDEPHAPVEEARRAAALDALATRGVDAELRELLSRPVAPDARTDQTRPLGELLSACRALLGANVLLHANARHAVIREAHLVLGDEALGDSLAAALEPLGLGLRVSAGLIWIVPAAEATEQGPRWIARRAALSARWGERQLGLDLGRFAASIEEAAQVPVVLAESARDSRARLAIPAQVTVERALELARLQAGVEFAVAWDAEGQPVIALGAAEEGPLLHAVRLAEEARELVQEPWAGNPSCPQPLRTLLRARHGTLAQTLQDLASEHDALERAPEAEALIQRALEAAAAFDDVWTCSRVLELASEDDSSPLASIAEEWERASCEDEVEEARELGASLRESWGHEALARHYQERIASLEQGAPYDEVFPRGFRAWMQETRSRAYARLLLAKRARTALALGVAPLDDEELGDAADDAAGVKLVRLQHGPWAGTPLAQAGRLLSLNGREVRSALDYLQALADAERGAPLRFRVEVDGEPVEVELPLGR